MPRLWPHARWGITTFYPLELLTKAFASGTFLYHEAHPPLLALSEASYRFRRYRFNGCPKLGLHLPPTKPRAGSVCTSAWCTRRVKGRGKRKRAAGQPTQASFSHSMLTRVLQVAGPRHSHTFTHTIFPPSPERVFLQLRKKCCLAPSQKRTFRPKAPKTRL